VGLGNEMDRSLPVEIECGKADVQQKNWECALRGGEWRAYAMVRGRRAAPHNGAISPASPLPF